MERRTTLPDGFAASCKLAHGSCKPLCKEVAAAVAKDSKGYPERFQTWIALTNEAYPNTDPDPASIDSMRLTIIYSVRLISFFLMEIMACSETMQIKQEEYAFQLADLNVANVPVYEYVHDIQAFALDAQQRTPMLDLTLMGEVLLEQQRVQRQERQQVLRRIMSDILCSQGGFFQAMLEQGRLSM